MPPQTKTIDSIIKNYDISQYLAGTTQDSKGQSLDDRVKVSLDFLHTDLDKTLKGKLPPDVINYLSRRKSQGIDPKLQNLIENLGEKSAKESFQDYYKLYKDDPEMMGALTNIWEKSGKPYFREASKGEMEKNRLSDIEGSGRMKRMDKWKYPLSEGVSLRDTVISYPRTLGSISKGAHNIGTGIGEMAHSYKRTQRDNESFPDYQKRLKSLERESNRQSYNERHKDLPFNEAVTHKVVEPFLGQEVSDILKGRAVQSTISSLMKKDSRYPNVEVGKTLKSENQIKEIMGDEFFESLSNKGNPSDFFPGKLTLSTSNFKDLKTKGIIPQSGPYKDVDMFTLEGKSPETEYILNQWLNQISINQGVKSGDPTKIIPDIKSEKDLIEYLDWVSKWKYHGDRALKFIPGTRKTQPITEMGEWFFDEGGITPEKREYTPYKK